MKRVGEREEQVGILICGWIGSGRVIWGMERWIWMCGFCGLE